MYSGHIEKKGKDRYTIIIESGRDSEGKRKRIKKAFHGGGREADKELARLITELEAGAYVKSTKMNFGEFLLLWLKEYAKDNVADRTYEFYEKMFENHTIPQLGPIPLDKLMPLQLQRYYNYLRTEGRKDGKPGGLAEPTVFKHHCIIHKALKTAVKWRLIRENPSDFVERPKRPDSDIASFYEPEQAIKMLDCARENEPINKYAILLVAVYGGNRRGEILGLRWQDIDWENNILRIRQTVQYTKEKGIFIKGTTKSKKGKRDIKVPDIVLDAIRQHQAKQQEFKDTLGKDYNDNDLIFCQDDGKPMHPDTISSWFPEFLSENKLPRIRFHDLRHTNITIMIANKVPDIEIARRAGHSDPATPHRLYGHVYASMKDEAMDAIENALQTPKASETPPPPEPSETPKAKIIAFPKRNLA
ncbi:tyrosine-type recombinase/integrase [Paradesulfitobacterium aromaticivorans]